MGWAWRSRRRDLHSPARWRRGQDRPVELAALSDRRKPREFCRGWHSLEFPSDGRRDKPGLLWVASLPEPEPAPAAQWRGCHGPTDPRASFQLLRSNFPPARQAGDPLPARRRAEALHPLRLQLWGTKRDIPAQTRAKGCRNNTAGNTENWNRRGLKGTTLHRGLSVTSLSQAETSAKIVDEWWLTAHSAMVPGIFVAGAHSFAPNLTNWKMNANRRGPVPARTEAGRELPQQTRLRHGRAYRNSTKYPLSSHAKSSIFTWPERAL